VCLGLRDSLYLLNARGDAWWCGREARSDRGEPEKEKEQEAAGDGELLLTRVCAIVFVLLEGYGLFVLVCCFNDIACVHVCMYLIVVFAGAVGQEGQAYRGVSVWGLAMCPC